MRRVSIDPSGVYLTLDWDQLAKIRPGGGGYSTSVYTGRVCPEVQFLTLLYTIFHEKGTPFVYFLLTNVEKCISVNKKFQNLSG